MGRVVVDASTLIDGLALPAGVGLLRHLAEQDELVVPSHCDSEVGNGLRKLVLRGLLTPEAARAAVQTYSVMALVRHPVTELLVRAFGLYETITFADALYLALAEKLGAPIVTLDAKLARAAAQITPHVIVKSPR